MVAETVATRGTLVRSLKTAISQPSKGEGVVAESFRAFFPPNKEDLRIVGDSMLHGGVSIAAGLVTTFELGPLVFSAVNRAVSLTYNPALYYSELMLIYILGLAAGFGAFRGLQGRMTKNYI